ncbi:MAG: porin [Alcanivoracaceae bacterium]
MNKKLLAIAVAAVVAMPAAALANVTVYGRAHVSVDMLDDGADYNELNLSSNSSRLGFKAEKKAENITGFVQIEQQVDFDDGVAFSSARDTFVGVKGDWGMVRIGQFDSPFKSARGPANLFGDQVGDMRNLTRIDGENVGSGAINNNRRARFDERNPNTIHFQTKDFSGLRFNLAYSIHDEASEDKLDGEKDEAISLSVTYKKDALDLALGYETYGEDQNRGERNAIRLAGAYSLSGDLKLVGFFQTVDYKGSNAAGNDALTSDVLGLGAEYKVTKATAVKGMVMTRSADADDSDSTMIALGVEHRLDSSLRVYANYAMVQNDDTVRLTPWNQGRTSGVLGAFGEDASALSLGLRFDF